jgi:two-component system, OmpR family, response regulator PrrA
VPVNRPGVVRAAPGRRPDVPGRGGRHLVVVVDDDESIRLGLAAELGREGFGVASAAGGHSGLETVERVRPDAVVLDLGLPDLDGRDVCGRLRGSGRQVPVIVLSGRAEVSERVGALAAGADDYLVKPFAVVELVARLRALLRRSGGGAGGGGTPAPLVVGDLVVDGARRLVWRAGTEVDLTRREFELLEVLARNAGIVLSRARLLELVWGYDWPADANVVDVFVSYLRRKLEAGGQRRILHTVRGVGFVLRVEP